MTAPDAETARWIRENAWDREKRATFKDYPTLYTGCRCRRGKCGACFRGRHDGCTAAEGTPATFLVTKTLFLGERAGIPTTVWEVGHPHAYRCPCHAEHIRPRGPTQPDIFDLLAEVS